MSVQAMGWVLEHEDTTTGTTRLVLLALANYADEALECYPSIERLGRNINANARTVQRGVEELVALGLVERVGRATDERIPAHRRPTLYRLILWTTDGVVHNVVPRGDSGGENGVTEVSPKPSLEPSNRLGARGDSSVTPRLDGPNRTSTGELFLPGSGVIGRTTDGYPDWSDPPPPRPLRAVPDPPTAS